MEDQVLTLKDYWDIGIGISGIVLTLAAVGIAIFIPAWQRKLELRRQIESEKTGHIAILAWLSDELQQLESDLLERKEELNGIDEINFTFDGSSHFRVALPPKIKELRNSPNLMITCPQPLLRLVWMLSELDIYLNYLRRDEERRADGLKPSSFQSFQFFFNKFHYEPMLELIEAIYDYGMELGLELHRGFVDAKKPARGERRTADSK